MAGFYLIRYRNINLISVGFFEKGRGNLVLTGLEICKK